MLHFNRTALAASLLLGLLASSSGCAALSQFPAPFITTKKQINTQMAIAQVQEDQGDIAGAKKIYEQIVEKRPKHAAAHQRLAVIAVKRGKPDTAEKHFDLARQADPENLKLLNDIGYFYYLENRLVEAETILREVVDEDPGQTRAVNNLGLVVGLQGRTSEAYDLFRQVGAESDAQANLAFVFAQLGDIQRAQMHYSKALTHNPKLKPAAQAMIQIAELCQQQKRYEAMLAANPGAIPTAAGQQPVAGQPMPAQPFTAQAAAGQTVTYNAPPAPQQGTPVPYYQPIGPQPSAVQTMPYYPAPATNENPTMPAYPMTPHPEPSPMPHYPSTAAPAVAP